VARNPLKRPAAPPPAPEKYGAGPVLGGLAGAGAVLALAMWWIAGTPAPRQVVPVTSEPLTAIAAPMEGIPAAAAAAPASERQFLDSSGAGAIAHTAGDYEAALARYREAIERNPEDAESHSNLGQMLVRLKRPVEALPHFDRAIQLLPQRWAYHFNRARALALLERWEEAVAGYRTAQQIFPDDYATSFNLGQALHRQGNEPAAVDQFRRAIDLDPADPSFRLALGISYERLEKRADAAAAYSEYLRLKPDAPDAEKVRARIAHLTGAS